jgi:hypothetical protein
MKTYTMTIGGKVEIDPLNIREVSRASDGTATITLQPFGFIPLATTFRDVIRDIHLAHMHEVRTGDSGVWGDAELSAS